MRRFMRLIWDIFLLFSLNLSLMNLSIDIDHVIQNKCIQKMIFCFDKKEAIKWGRKKIFFHIHWRRRHWYLHIFYIQNGFPFCHTQFHPFLDFSPQTDALNDDWLRFLCVFESSFCWTFVISLLLAVSHILGIFNSEMKDKVIYDYQECHFELEKMHFFCNWFAPTTEHENWRFQTFLTPMSTA